MKPKTAFRANIVLLATYAVMIVAGYLFSFWDSLFQQIVFFILPVAPIIGIIDYLRNQRRQKNDTPTIHN